MDNLIFSLNATVPLFLLMVLGLFLRKIGWIDEMFAEKMNRFVFMVPLPVLVFRDLATVDFEQVWDVGYILFCFMATLLSIAISAGVSLAWKEREIRGEFIQACYRSSAAILGIALIQNIYGSAGMAPLMFIGSVPLYNVMAVIVLSLFKPGQQGLDKKVLKKSVFGIATNPIIIAIIIGLFWSALRIPLTGILGKTVSDIANIASPMGLITMGASFSMSESFTKIKPTVAAAFLKLIGVCTIFLPMAVMMGFRQEGLVAILVMLGSATTVSCFVMAKNMGHEGVVSSGVIMLTTLLSAFTLTGWLYVLKSLELI